MAQNLFSYCLWTTDKRQKVTKVKRKSHESTIQYKVIIRGMYSSLDDVFELNLLPLVCRRTHNFEVID